MQTKTSSSSITILITGGCGFVGSNLSVLLKQQYPVYNIIAVDNLKRRGSELNIPRLTEAGVQFIHGDIRNKEDLHFDTKIDFIIDAAAEPSVLAGMGSALDYVINTNLDGTVNTLQLAARHKAKFIFLSTSRVYPIAYLDAIAFEPNDTRFVLSDAQPMQGMSARGISETFPLDSARSVYGATKLASEMLAIEFREFFGVDYVINRCGVIAGPYQMGKVDQGVVTLWMARHYWKKEVNYIGYGGTGKQVRDILHIADLFRLIVYQLHHFEVVSGQTLNAGGGLTSSVSLKELTILCQQITGNTVAEIAVPETRKGDVPVYITDNTKITTLTGWKPEKNATHILEDIFTWLQANEQQLAPILNK
ncbi:MAG TPA: NAD-dependent epimerase/dehydratase family protein [Ferruginibacter sp.]|nr:NAD-dependent epimerase/dehydratase family protein [Ferruginibacter sp.]HMP19500.1 NAD-dependent epimerase/dehydratase family protein [Ferruginibacter sp.]